MYKFIQINESCIKIENLSNGIIQFFPTNNWDISKYDNTMYKIKLTGTNIQYSVTMENVVEPSPSGNIDSFVESLATTIFFS
jgi:hypothetical protein